MSGRVDPLDRVRGELVARVRARCAELEEAIVLRVCDDAYEVAGAEDAEYAAGLRLAVAAAVEHGLSGIERGEGARDSIPPEVMAQAQRAARLGIKLDAVLRRYVLGSTVLGDFLMQEAERGGLAGHGPMLRNALSAQAAVLDRLMTAITDEYMLELGRLARSPAQRRAERVRGLLAGGLGDTSELGYELGGWHLATIVTGLAAEEALRDAAATLGRRLLCVPHGEDCAWGWFGGQRKLAVRDVEHVLAGDAYAGLSVAVGEPGMGVEGWRLSHRQAQAALRVALHRARRFTSYADVALLASVLHDEALADSLVEIYLSPLGEDRNGGAALRQTLRAYFAAEHNASAAASALGVARRTFEKRLRTIEEKLGRSLCTRQAELEVALRLEELEDGPGADDT